MEFPSPGKQLDNARGFNNSILVRLVARSCFDKLSTNGRENGKTNQCPLESSLVRPELV
jgi:hypothetical protein